MELVNELIKGLLPEEEKKQTTALYAGGFKPPTSGHFEVVEQALKQNPEIDELIIFVGAKDRDGISQTESLLIWDIYKQYLPFKVTIQPSSKPPIGAIYSFAKEHPTREILWVIGAREGNEEDFKDITQRTSRITKYPNVELRTIVTSGGVSGTAARNAAKVSFEKFEKFVPDMLSDEEKREVYGLVSGKVQENYVLQDLKKQYSIDLDLYDNGKYLTLSRISMPKDKRGQGIGSKVMNQIIQYADKENKRIYLTPTKTFGASSVSRLEKFYKQFGFKKKDKSDFSARETMVRMPLNEADPKTGTGKKPKGSGRRLYTDEDPKDTVGIKFSTRQDIVDTLNKTSFKNKSHARQSQIINLIHQRVRAAYGRAKDPAVKKRLKTALDYAEQRKEASKKKTQRLKNQKNENVAPNHDGKAAPFGSGYDKVEEEVTKPQLNAVEKVADSLFRRLGIDVEFTRHFLSRVNDERNGKPISGAELIGMFKRLYKYYGKALANIDKDMNAVARDLSNYINIPLAIDVQPNETDLIAKTIMRKKNFKTSNHTFDLHENASYTQNIDIKKEIADLTKHMIRIGLNIQPLPKLVLKHGDSENAREFLGKTAYYDPNTQTIVLYTEGRHPKDIVRSYSHEMIHHIQNLEDRLGTIQGTNTMEDDHLNQIEQEANLMGTMTFRNWTDSLNEKKNKDPFGINAYAMELGRLREEEDIKKSPFSKDIEENILSDIKEYENIPELKIDLKDTYQYTFNSNIWEFYDDVNNIRIIVKLKSIPKNIVEFKFYSLQDGKHLSFNKLKRYNPKVMNTIFKIFIDEVLPKNSKILIQPFDYLRYRLFRAMLNNNLDGNQYKIDTEDDPMGQSTILIHKKNDIKEVREDMKYQIYCDMDGVLADFERGYEELTGIDLQGEFRPEGKEFWDPISKAGVKFWAGLKWMSDGQELWNYIKPHTPKLLSAPSREESSRIGKYVWVKHKIPGTKLILRYADKKKELATPTSILIDDRKANIDSWEAAGGIGILHTSTANTIKELKKLGL